MEGKVDTNLYSRQIGTFGMETMGKLIQMKVLLIGLRGLGVETAKNIILAGPKQVTLFDSNIAKINDLAANFFLTEDDVGKNRRDQACLPKLAELNPYVQCTIMEGKDILAKVKDFNIVVITELMDKNELIKIDTVCRDNKIGFIYTATLGISGYCFVDFGNEHFIKDKNGEECKTYLARIITKDKESAVTIDDTIGSGKLALADGDYVTFREVQGMTELNDGKPRKVKFISPISFSIGDTSSYSDYISGGVIEQVKVAEPVSYSPFSKLFETPYESNPPEPFDFSKFGRNELLHCGFLAVHDFYEKHKKKLPELNNMKQAKEVVVKAKEIYDNAKKNGKKWIENAQEFDEKVIKNIARWARSEISPVCAFLGGVIAQEIVKLTGKYTPINQWLWFDFFETVENINDNADRTLKGTRYDDQIAIYGNKIQNKLNESNIFMIGAGALGCEFLKNFALMGISTRNGKQVVVTDNDNIEVSNLNRQFLFRKENVGQSKSKCACVAIKKMNKNFNCKDLQSRVGIENEHIFDEDFWKSQTFVINAVDNINARKYIDNQCTIFNIPLIDSGTLGTKAHVQMIIPQVTCCYNDSQDPPEESIPMCTLHNFPAMIEHCIEWGRDHFNEYFIDVITDSKKLIENPKQFYDDLKKEGNTTLQLQKLRNIKEHIVLAVEKSFDKIIEFAVMQYTNNFDFRIRQLLNNFPPDFKNTDGSMFWSGSKRVPNFIKYDANEPLALMFVKNYAIILAKALSIPFVLDDAYIKKVSSQVKIPAFVPQTIKIKVNDNEQDVPASSSAIEQDEIQLAALIKELNIYDKAKADPSKINPEEFEKDDDSNGHIDFIHACSNLRARNYKIKECDRQKTKMIAGKIIPAIATTTAAITGIVSMQLFTLLQTNDISFMRNSYLNLAVCLFVMTEPGPKIEMRDKDYDPLLLGPVKAIPPKWTVWDTISIDGPMTIRQFIDFIKKKYDVDVSVITSNKTTIMQTFMASNKNRYDVKIEQVYNTYSNLKLRDKQKYLFLEVSGDVGEATALMPLFKYNFKK